MSKSSEEQAKQSAPYYVKAYGESPFPSMVLFSLVAAQNLRPARWIPLFISGNLVLSSYMNVAGYKVEGAGQMAVWSGIYWLLAARRKQTFHSKLSIPGGIRAATMGLCAANVVGGGWAWLTGRRECEEHQD